MASIGRRRSRAEGVRAFSARGASALFSLSGILLVLLGGCASRDNSAGKPVVAASIHPLGALAEEIAGNDAAVLVLLPPGASPHSFEPTPRAVAEGSEASLVLRVGVGLDDWTRPIVRDAVARGAPEIVVSSFIDSLLCFVVYRLYQ